MFRISAFRTLKRHISCEKLALNCKLLASTNRNYSMVPIPENGPNPYIERASETITDKRARLLYQSRKRGMLENGLILSTFASKYLTRFNVEQLVLYDQLINRPSNDWDLYYWATGIRDTPSEFQNEIMELLKQHVKNELREVRLRQPDLY